jgi:hypothetical protein
MASSSQSPKGFVKKIVELREKLQTIADEMNDYYEERSESWQESDAGETFSSNMEIVNNAIGELEELVEDN